MAAAVGATYKAWSFHQSIGANTHMTWQNADSGYQYPTVVEQSIAYLGATHVRDGIPLNGWTLPEYAAIASTGVKFDIIANSPTVDFAGDLTQVDRLVQSVPGGVASMEGVNEFYTSNAVYNGVSSLGNPSWAQLFGPAFYAAVKADPTLAGVPVVAASENSSLAQLAAAGNLSNFVDSSNYHVYFGSGSQPAANLAAGIAAAQSTAPGKPVLITESGYYTAVDAMDWGGGGVTPAVQAVLTTNLLLDAFRDGVGTTYLYELMNNYTNPPSTDLEGSFGLFLADGTPKPAATAIHNLTTILADTGATASSFQTGTLAANITGLPSTGNSLVLEKSNGTYELVVWNEAKVWDQPTKSAVTPSAVPVTVDLGATYQTVKLYDPIKGASATQTLSNVRQVQLSLVSDPIIIEVLPGTAPVVVPPVTTKPGSVLPSPTTIGSGPDTLALSVSEDAYGGDAQFTVSVDGIQTGGVQTATASHATGQAQVFNVLGTFGAGSHTATLNFLNDAWGGTAATDRNFYLGSATMDGAAVSNSSLSLMNGGPQSFAFTGSSGSDTLDLYISEDAWQGDAQYTVAIDGTTIGGVRTTTASHAAGATQDVVLKGSWGAGAHTVGVTFLNDVYGGTAATDRNLYVDQLTYNGRAGGGMPAALMSNSTDSFSVAASTTTITLHLSEDAWQGDAQYAVTVDGKALGLGGFVTASHALSQAQLVELSASLAVGSHDIGVSFLNDAWGGTAATDRNLYVTGIDVNAAPVAGASAALMSAGTSHFQIVVPAA